MTDMTKFLKDLLPAANDIFVDKFSKFNSININLPSDNLGFWFTQGVPLGLFLAHILMTIVGERDIGRCFPPNSRDSPLSVFQVQYITELCVDQAIHYECFDDYGKLKEICQSSYLCDDNFNYSNPVTFEGDKAVPSIFRTLFFYRYYIWFLCFFTFIRALPQILWKLYCSADIRKAVQDIAIMAEFQHAMCAGLNSLVNSDNLERNPLSPIRYSTEHGLWMEKMDRLVIEEVAKRAQGKFLFLAYVMRKVADICLDGLIFILLLWFYYNRTPFNHLVFVCDLHRDRDNIFLCNTLKQQFIPCTVSFGFEFVITGFICFFVMIFDFVVQFGCLLKFTKLGHIIIRMISCGRFFSGDIRFWDDFISRELELGQNTQWGYFDKSFMYSPNDLYLVGMLYRQSNVSHGHFLKMMADKMLEQLHPTFDSPRQTSTLSSQETETTNGNSKPESDRNNFSLPGRYCLSSSLNESSMCLESLT